MSQCLGDVGKQSKNLCSPSDRPSHLQDRLLSSTGAQRIEDATTTDPHNLVLALDKVLAHMGTSNLSIPLACGKAFDCNMPLSASTVLGTF